MFAVFRTGGKQYKVSEGDVITAMALRGLPGDRLQFTDVLMLTDGDNTQINPKVTIEAEITEQTRGPKVYAFKKRRRKNSKRKRGHRQDLTCVRIVSIALN